MSDISDPYTPSTTTGTSADCVPYWLDTVMVYLPVSFLSHFGMWSLASSSLLVHCACLNQTSKLNTVSTGKEKIMIIRVIRRVDCPSMN